MRRGRILVLCLGLLVLTSCGTQGDSCQQPTGVGLSGCDTGFECLGGECVCRSPSATLEQGSDCVSGFSEQCRSCRDELLCNALTRRCEPPHFQPEGGSCQEDVFCMLGLVCNANTTVRRCEAPGAHGNGEACGQTANCSSGLVCRTLVDPGLCRPRGDSGTLCTLDEECVTGLVCNTGYTPRECRAPGGMGARCGGRDLECTTGLTCDTTSAPSQCR